ncbi:tyrosine--tRNA ligase [Aquihabitans sp. McL0605]|uniref:tyrosine--tRNA ligase n=1 Tax=Aquihabitans sp. McL0605 TaxID=3415671 RepID=UPI003CEE4DE8
MTDARLLDDLVARGLVQECTDQAGLAARMAEGPITVYNGCDPTADSLHVGNLLGLLVLRRFQEAGHRPLALVGGATGMIGDPSGRSEERNLLDEETLAANVAAIKGQISRILDLSGGPTGGALVDNRDWTEGVSYLDFLREVGKHVTVGTMLARESVKNRMASEHGISYTEFSYMLIQANDFLQLEQAHGCQLQVGGSDQLGNMLGGIDLIRRVRQRPAWALAWPLLTAADGTKLGKTTGARIWLDPARTSPYQLFQHWMATDDRQIGQFLRQFTLLPLTEIDELLAAHEAEPGRRAAQRRLAHEVTALVHGPDEAVTADRVSDLLFGADPTEATATQLAAVGREVPSLALGAGELAGELDLADVLARDEFLVASKGEARRAIAQGGVYLNGARVGEGQALTDGDLLHGRYVLIRKGKKAYGLIDAGANGV